MQFCQGRVRADLASDPMLRFALTHALMIVGEAGSTVTQSTRDALPNIAWAAIVGMRHRLVQAYYDVDTDVLWRSVNEKPPELNQGLRAALAE
ncbi:MAG: HepT-like ribonuclease domain-containing protein [Betaproteobacteria bacterium]